MAITNYDGIIASRGSGKGEDQWFQKTGTVGGVTQNWYSFIKAGGIPSSVSGYSAATAAGTKMTSTMSGAISLQNTTGDDKYLLTFGAMVIGGVEQVVYGLVDVLWAGGSIQTNSSSTQTVGSATTLRSTNWRSHRLMVMASTIVGATAATMTIWYTDAGDTATTVDVVLATAGAQGRLMPAGQLFVNIPNGIKSINSVQVQTAQGAGGYDLFICKPITFQPTVAINTWVERDLSVNIDGIYKLDKDSSFAPSFLSVVAFTQGTTARGMNGFIRTCAG